MENNRGPGRRTRHKEEKQQGAKRMTDRYKENDRQVQGESTNKEKRKSLFFLNDNRRARPLSIQEIKYQSIQEILKDQQGAC